MCRVPKRSATYCTRERVSTSFHSKKVKLVFSNNGKDLVFLVTGRAFVDGGGRGVQPGASRLWDPQGRPPFLEEAPTQQALTSLKRVGGAQRPPKRPSSQEAFGEREARGVGALGAAPLPPPGTPSQAPTRGCDQVSPHFPKGPSRLGLRLFRAHPSPNRGRPAGHSAGARRWGPGRARAAPRAPQLRKGARV